MMNADPQFGAIGPSHVDPRTGEILDADIAFEGMQTRKARQERAQLLGRGSPDADAAPAALSAPFEGPGSSPPRHDPRLCQAGALAAEQLGYALDVLEARDELDPDSPIAQQFVLDYVKQVVMHEVGHALGLRHNFRASRAYTEDQLSDPEFTRVHGTAASVMEYNAVNLPPPGRSGGMPFQTALGPYDYWAIEYAYKPMPAGSDAEAERAELQRIAARSSEPLLAYGTDEDNAFGIDPETIQLDLGSDPIAFASKRLQIARDLFMRQETRTLSPQHDYAVLRRSLAYAIADVTRAMSTLARQIGGVRTLRDFPGSGRDPLQPVAAAVQRQALDLIAGAVLASGGLEISPALQRRLVPDFQEREEFSLPTDYAVPQRLLELQRAVLGYLMSDTIAARILDSVGKFDRPAEAFQLSELYARLNAAVWKELGSGQSIAAARRELQREHVNRLAASLLRPSPQARADARALARVQGRELLARLESSLRRRGALDAETAAHLADAADTLRLALVAPIERQAL
jgi:Met-zincin